MDEERYRNTGGRFCTGRVPYTEIHKKDGTSGRGNRGRGGRKQEKIQGWIEKGRRKELEGWAVQVKAGMKEKNQKKLEAGLEYIKNNWQGIRRRVKNEEGIAGSSTESHISHVLSSRLSSRLKGWCMEGCDKMSQLRIYWKNGGSMLELVRYQKEEKHIEKTEEEKCSSATEMVTWENRHRKTNGKYIEALHASISSQISAKIFFNAGIAGLRETKSLPKTFIFRITVCKPFFTI